MVPMTASKLCDEMRKSLMINAESAATRASLDSPASRCSCHLALGSKYRVVIGSTAQGDLLPKSADGRLQDH